MDVTREQAQRANYLVNTAEAFGALIELAGMLSEQVRGQLRAAHGDATVGMCCNAHCEGLDCCVDILTGDLSRFAPEKVEQARAVLQQYRAQIRT